MLHFLQDSLPHVSGERKPQRRRADAAAFVVACAWGEGIALTLLIRSEFVVTCARVWAGEGSANAKFER